jgi:hypothetical protein
MIEPLGRIAIQGSSIDETFTALVSEINAWIKSNYEEETEVVGVNLKGPPWEVDRQELVPMELVVKFYTDEAHNLFRLIYLKRCEPYFPHLLGINLIKGEPEC